MSINLWKILSEDVVFEKYGRQVIKRTFVMPGEDEADFYIKKEKNTAVIFALTKDNQVILVKQYRPGPDKILLEMPGGFIDDATQNPRNIAEKELLEETGYKGTFQLVTKCIDDAYSTVERSIFVATKCKKISEPNLEKTEFVEVALVTISDFRQLLQSGQMTDIEAGYLALDYLKLL